MDYTYTDPPKPSFSRWWRFVRTSGGQSVLRMLTNEHLSGLPLAGKILDMGGGENAKYLTLLPPGLSLESVNIDPDIRPTYLVQPGHPLPLADNSYDAVICLNTLEHIYDSPAVLAELFRVVRPGGAVHVMVPFMFRIHGHPDDYFRATPSWWRETFRRCGFSQMELSPLVWGRGATRAVVPGFHGLMPRTRMYLAMLADVVLAKLLLKGDRISGRRGDRICATSPGWFMTGRKAERG